MLVAIMVHSGENLGSNPKVGERQRGGEILPPTGNNAERESARPSAELFAEAGRRATRRDLTGEIMGDPPPKQIKEAISRSRKPSIGPTGRQPDFIVGNPPFLDASGSSGQRQNRAT